MRISINPLHPLTKSTKFGFLCFSLFSFFLLMVSIYRPQHSVVSSCLPSFNATDHVVNTHCRTACLSLQRTHIGFFIKPPVCILDWLSHAPYTDLKKTHNAPQYSKFLYMTKLEFCLAYFPDSTSALSEYSCSHLQSISRISSCTSFLHLFSFEFRWVPLTYFCHCSQSSSTTSRHVFFSLLSVSITASYVFHFLPFFFLNFDPSYVEKKYQMVIFSFLLRKKSSKRSLLFHPTCLALDQ